MTPFRRALALAALLAAQPLAVAAQGAACRDDQVLFRLDGGQARFSVEIADEPAEMQLGLMHRESMPASAGMLFVYPSPRPAVFWMKDTLLPLDMIFIDQTGTVTRVHENAVPRDETPIPGGDSVLMVLEINGGLARRIGIVPGAMLAHPRLPQDRAAFPCQ